MLKKLEIRLVMGKYLNLRKGTLRFPKEAYETFRGLKKFLTYLI